MDFFDRLKYEVVRNNTTQEWVASKAQVPYGTFRKWLTNKTMPNADQAVSIARALGTTVEYLVDGTTISSLTVPVRLRPIVEELKSVADEDLSVILMIVKPFAEKGRSNQLKSNLG